MPSTRAQLKHPLIPTETSKRVLRARLSLRETQTEFAERFVVTRLTVHKWETGKSFTMRPIYKRILEGLLRNLKAEGRLLDESVFETIYRELVEEKGLSERFRYTS